MIHLRKRNINGLRAFKNNQGNSNKLFSPYIFAKILKMGIPELLPGKIVQNYIQVSLTFQVENGPEMQKPGKTLSP